MVRKLKNEELNRKTISEFKQAPKTPLIIVLDDVRSLNNIGSIFRTADAFLVETIYLCGITATPPHKDIQKTALGATETVAWKYFKTINEAVEELKYLNYTVYAVEQAEGSILLNQFMPIRNQKIALIFGNEVKGVDAGIIPLTNGCIEIPQYGTKHSFNIAVSAGIVLWDIFIKLKISIGEC